MLRGAHIVSYVRVPRLLPELREYFESNIGLAKRGIIAEPIVTTSNWELEGKCLTTGPFRGAGSDGVCGLLADGQPYPKTFGGKLEPVSASGVTGEGYPPPAACISHQA